MLYLYFEEIRSAATECFEDKTLYITSSKTRSDQFFGSVQNLCFTRLFGGI